MNKRRAIERLGTGSFGTAPRDPATIPVTSALELAFYVENSRRQTCLFRNSILLGSAFQLARTPTYSAAMCRPQRALKEEAAQVPGRGTAGRPRVEGKSDYWECFTVPKRCL